jgi:hypothetical protein
MQKSHQRREHFGRLLIMAIIHQDVIDENKMTVETTSLQYALCAVEATVYGPLPHQSGVIVCIPDFRIIMTFCYLPG